MICPIQVRRERIARPNHAARKAYLVLLLAVICVGCDEVFPADYEIPRLRVFKFRQTWYAVSYVKDPANGIKWAVTMIEDLSNPILPLNEPTPIPLNDPHVERCVRKFVFV